MMGLQSDEDKNQAQEIQKKEIAKAYGKYVKAFTPRPKYVSNCLRAFLVGGAICAAALWFRNALLTGLGVFDVIAKFAGAGVIVPITGFANSMVASAIEYKKEGPVLGVGSKLFSVAGPVLVCGISCATIVGVLYWLFG